MLRTLLAVILALAVSAAGAQIVNRPVAAGAISNPGTSLPATCAVGYVYFKSNSTAGQNLHLCTASNTWTQMTGGNLANPVTPSQGGSGVANSKNLTWSASLTLAGTDATTMTFPTTSATIARTDAANTFTGNQSVSGAGILSTTSGPINLNNSGGFGTQLNPQGFGCMHGAYAANDYCETWLLGGSGNNNNEIGHYIRSTLSGNGTGVGTAALTIGKVTWTGVVISPQTAQLTLASNGGLSTATYYATTAPNTQTGATYTVVDTDNWVIANRAGTVTLTLPTASSYTGRAITVRTIQAQTVVSASSNVVPCVGGSAGTAILAATAGKWATLVSDASNWQIMACN
jgi:hypothetical protein